MTSETQSSTIRSEAHITLRYDAMRDVFCGVPMVYVYRMRWRGDSPDLDSRECVFGFPASDIPDVFIALSDVIENGA